MLKEIFILISDLAGIVSLILIIIFWLKLRKIDRRIDLISKRIDLLTNIVLNPGKETLRKELKKQARETAKLNLEICDDFKYVDGEN
ncbi:hypothetical protein ES705_40332 [subsurface metagenome]